MSQSARQPSGTPELPRPSRIGTRASSLADRLVKLAAAGSTGTLPVTGPSDGAIHFRDGNITGAQSSRTPGAPAAPTPLAAVPWHGLVSDGKVRAREKPAPPRPGLPDDLTALEPTIDAVLDLVISQSACERFRSVRRSGTGPAEGLAVDVLLTELARRRHLLQQMSAAVTADTVVIRNPRLHAPRVQVSAQKAGIEGVWAPRELRHTFVSVMSESGVAVEEIAHLAGHASSRTTETIYRHELRPVITTGADAMDRIFI